MVSLCRLGQESRSSPFNSAHRFTLPAFTIEQIVALLTQYVENQGEFGRNVNFSTRELSNLAKLIHQRTGGHPGLVGVCLYEIALKGISSETDWHFWCGTNLTRQVQEMQICSLMTGAALLLNAAGQSPRLQQLLEDLLLCGCCIAAADETAFVERLVFSGIAEEVASDTDELIKASSLPRQSMFHGFIDSLDVHSCSSRCALL